MKTKYRYSVDKSNRLIIKRKQRRLIPNGIFSIDKSSQLIYWLNEPVSWRKKYNLPNKITFTGNWHFSPNYDLELVLDQTKNQFKGDRLILKGEVISVDRDVLGLEVKTYDEQGLLHLQILKLSGSWQTDAYNRLSFAVKKKALPDILTLEGAWQVNQNQQIIYAYEKTDLKTKSKTSHTLTFEGFWQINNANKLTYILARSLSFRFDFRVQLESPNLYPQEGVIKYRLGIGLKGLSPQGTVPQPKIISLYGTWKFSRKLGLIFQMDYGQGRVHGIEFGTHIFLTQRNKITFVLKNKKREPLGINITFTYKFLK